MKLKFEKYYWMVFSPFGIPISFSCRPTKQASERWVWDNYVGVKKMLSKAGGWTIQKVEIRKYGDPDA